jgi:Flp pilus assembly protein TadG
MTPIMVRQPVTRLFRDDGTVAIEFAVVGLLFFALLLGSIELGRAMWMRNSFQFAAEEGARYALVNFNASESKIEGVAQDRLVGSLKTADIKAQFIETEPRYLEVTISQDFTPVIKLVSTGLIKITGHARITVKEKIP